MSPGLQALYNSQTITEILHQLRRVLPSKICITVIDNLQETKFDYEQLWSRSLRAAKVISQHSRLGDRVLLAMSTSPEFIEFFFGCILSGRIAVPIPVEKANSRYSRIGKILKDCQPSLVVLKSNLDYKNMMSSLGSLETIVVEDLRLVSDNARLDSYLHTSTANQIAIIQYTSGSTSSPKGVVLTHANIIANLRMIQKGMQITENERVVSWLPLHHDMGLIGNLLSFVTVGASTFLFPYQDFSRDPLSWLELMSEKKATLSGAPTFAFDLIAKRIERTPKDNLNLSSMRLLYCGSERISVNAIQRFYKSTALYGLDNKTFFPCYGMAEASLYISGGFEAANDLPQVVVNGIAYPLCGTVAEGLAFRVVGESGKILNANEVGEIQVCGDSISVGYWTDLSSTISQGVYEGHTIQWLQTGDLGCVTGTRIAIVGRLKDVIKIRGRSVYSEDIELELEQLEEWFGPNSVVALPFLGQNGEGITIVGEVLRNRREGNFEELHRDIQILLSKLDLKAEHFVILSPGSLPKTSSGKKQRSRTSELLKTRALKILWQSDAFMNEKSHEAYNTTKTDEDNKIPDLVFKIKKYSETINFLHADERRTYPADLVNNLRRDGLLGLLIPKHLGGSELSNQEFAKIGEALGALDLTFGSLVGNHNTIGVLPILKSTLLKNKDSILKTIAQEGAIAAFAVTEPEAGSNPRSMRASARYKNGNIKLNGEKIWIGNAMLADFVSIFVREYREDGTELGISGFLLQRGEHRFRIEPEQLTLGLKAMPQNRLILDDCEVTDGDRLTEPGQGMVLAYSAMEYARFGLAALAIGAMRMGLSYFYGYANSRAIWTGSLLSNAYIQDRCVQAEGKLRSLKSLVDSVARELDRSKEINKIATLAAKIIAGEWSFQILDEVLQFSGGRGFTETFGIARFWRDARIIRIFEGPTETLAFQLGAIISRDFESGIAALAQLCGQHVPDSLKEMIVENIRDQSFLWKEVSSQISHVELGLFFAKVFAAANHAIVNPDNSSIDREIEVLNLETRIRRSSITKQTEFTSFLNPMINRKSQPFYDIWDGYSQNMKQDSVPKKNAAIEGTRLFNRLNDQTQPAHRPATYEQVVRTLTEWLKKFTKTKNVDFRVPISSYGVDSLLAYELICFVEDEFNFTIPEALLGKQPSIDDLTILIISKEKVRNHE